MIPMFRAAESGLLTQELQLNVIANNLANINTPGFRKSMALFQDVVYTDLLPGSPGETPLRVGGGATLGGIPTLFSQGAIQGSDSPLHLAIQGDGFFAIRQADGQVAYTRDGSFQTDATGRMITNSGLQLDPPITIPVGVQRILVQNDGRVLAELDPARGLEEIGRIQLARFNNPGGLEALGGNLFAPTVASGAAIVAAPGANGLGTVLSGSLEGSNVELAEEMTNMLTAQRSYGLSVRAFQTMDEMLGLALNLRT